MNKILFTIILGILVINLANGSQMELWFNDTGMPKGKSCDIPPRNPNSNYIMGDKGCP